MADRHTEHDVFIGYAHADDRDGLSARRAITAVPAPAHGRPLAP